MGRHCRDCYRRTWTGPPRTGCQSSGTGISGEYGPDYVLTVLSLVGLVLGIMLLVTKESKIAYALGVVGLVTALLAVLSGGTIGAGIIGTILAVFGARKIDTLWDAYQARR